jgi:endoglucanase
MLESEGYAFDFMVRGDQPQITFDVRFLDSKTSDSLDLPWRMGITIDDLLVDFNSQWHHLHIPLNEFTERGSWYIDTWYNPRNEFDWSDVERLEIVPEVMALGNSHLWFDQIMITDQDTAQARVDTLIQSLSARRIDEIRPLSLEVYPNPTDGPLTLQSNLQERIRFELFNVRGTSILEGFADPVARVSLNGHPDGLYLLRVSGTKGFQEMHKIILQCN